MLLQNNRIGCVLIVNLKSFHGTIMMIHDIGTGQNGQDGCYKMMTVQNNDGTIVNFVVAPTTYVLGHVRLEIGDEVTGYYDGNAPAPLIYPPQYQAVIMVKENPNQYVKVDYFNSDLISSDGQLKLNVSPATSMILTNGQPFTGNPADRNIIVIYGPATKSIPAQTEPYQIIVLC